MRLFCNLSSATVETHQSGPVLVDGPALVCSLGVVEVPGIEPGSYGAVSDILRAQPE